MIVAEGQDIVYNFGVGIFLFILGMVAGLLIAGIIVTFKEKE